MLLRQSILLIAGVVLLGAVGTFAKNGQNWAVLVAGSNGWYNYRHQADVCHAYQILHKNGIPDSNIIVMMYDDLAKNKQYVRRCLSLVCSIPLFSKGIQRPAH